MKCPACSLDVAGPLLCSGCGAVLAATSCRSCQAPLSAGVKACSNCGTRAQPQASFNTGLVAGIAVALAVGAGFLLARGPSGEPPAPGLAAPPAPAAMLPPAPAAQPAEPATPRDQADELFNVAMMASERGDATTTAQAVPAAIAAYRALGTLDDDGTFHIGTLQLAAADFSGARATAETLLAKSPGHLLALSVAARAAAGAGDAAGARGYHQRLLTAWDAEATRQLPEYLDHKKVLPMYREAAQKAVEAR